MNLLMTFIQKAIGQGVAILFGATGDMSLSTKNRRLSNIF